MIVLRLSEKLWTLWLVISDLRLQPSLKVKILTPVEELVGSLQTYELDFPRSNKKKSIALKFVDEIDSSNNELAIVDVACLAK